MKYILSLAVASFLIGCGNNSSTDHSKHDTSSNVPVQKEEAENIKQVSPMYIKLNANVAAHIKNFFDHYIHIKTALVKGDSAEAANGAKAIVVVLKEFDRSHLPVDQKKSYDQFINELRTAATNIASAQNLTQQRFHFSDLSLSAYDFAKSFGAGRTIYHEHCPMAFDNKGAMWLSESKDVMNPYYGAEMLDCGTVEEVIENNPR